MGLIKENLFDNFPFQGRVIAEITDHDTGNITIVENHNAFQYAGFIALMLHMCDGYYRIGVSPIARIANYQVDAKLVANKMRVGTDNTEPLKTTFDDIKAPIFDGEIICGAWEVDVPDRSIVLPPWVPVKAKISALLPKNKANGQSIGEIGLFANPIPASYNIYARSIFSPKIIKTINKSIIFTWLIESVGVGS